MLDSVMVQQISWFVQLIFDSSAGGGGGGVSFSISVVGVMVGCLENVETRFLFFFLPFLLLARTLVTVCLRERPGFQLAAVQLLLFYSSSSSSFHPSFRGNQLLLLGLVVLFLVAPDLR